MKTLSVTYKSIEYHFPFPEQWNELEKEELLAYCKPVITGNESHVKAEMLIDILDHRSRNSGLPTKWWIYLDTEDTVLQAFPLLDFLYRENTLTKQLIPSITLQGVELLGPKEEFNDMTVGEYEEAGIYRQLYAQEQDDKWLVQLASVLYRPSVNGKRKAYDDKDGEKSKLLEEAPKAFLGAVYVWFVGCQNHLIQLFPRVFTSDANGTPDPMGFPKTVIGASGDKMGTVDKVKQKDIKDFLFYLLYEMENAEEMERKLNSKK